MEICLLLTVAGMVSSNVTVPNDVNEPPVVVPEGSSVDLPCNVWTDNNPERYRVSWYFNSKGPSRTGLQNRSNLLFNNCSNALPLTLHNVTRNDSGWYFCTGSKEIPFLKQNKSNWTRIVVDMGLQEIKPSTYRPTSKTGVIEKESEKPQEKPPFVWNEWWMWIAVGVSGFVLVILLIVCLVLRRRQLKQRDLESPVYANMHRVNGSRQPSPQARPSEHNTLKTESPYQNLHTPDVKRYEHSRRLPPNREQIIKMCGERR